MKKKVIMDKVYSVFRVVNGCPGRSFPLSNIPLVSFLREVKKQTIARKASRHYDDDIAFRFFFKGRYFTARYVVDIDKYAVYPSSEYGGITRYQSFVYDYEPLPLDFTLNYLKSLSLWYLR